jgi:hypothetical protein
MKETGISGTCGPLTGPRPRRAAGGLPALLVLILAACDTGPGSIPEITPGRRKTSRGRPRHCSAGPESCGF